MAMNGWYQLGKHDARMLARMIGQLASNRNRVERANMALFAWSQMRGKGRPCPYFAVGLRTIALECGVTEMQARRFMERAEQTGWIVRLGDDKNKSGRYMKRTFSWVAEEAAEDAGKDLGEWLESVTGVSSNEHTHVFTNEHTLGEKVRKNEHTHVFNDQLVGNEHTSEDRVLIGGASPAAPGGGGQASDGATYPDEYDWDGYDG